MACSSHSKGSVSVDLFNLPTLPYERRVATSYLDIPVDFYLPDRKNSKISKIVSRQAFDRQTPDGNEGYTYDNDENLPNSVEMPLSDEKFSQLQVRDEKIKNLRVRVKNGEYSDFYKIENNILYRMVVESNHKFDAAVLPAELINTALFLGHNQSGHNSFQRTYAAIKRIYYWKGMHKDILKYCKGCSQCAKHRVEKRKFIEQSFKPGAQPMEFISMDLVGEFHPPSSKGN